MRLAHRVDERRSFNDASYRVDGKKTKESHTTAAASCGTAPTARGSPEYVMSTSRDFRKMTCLCVFALYDSIL